MKLYFRFLLFWSCFFLSISLKAQHPVYYHLTEKDGLPDIEFYQILEDKEGFIWLAANKGLFRYDGKEFLNFSHPKKRGLSVFNLELDTEGKIWCNNISGQYFYVANNTLHLFIDIEKEANGQLSKYYIYNKNLIVNTSSGILNIDILTKEKKYLFNLKNGVPASFFKNDTFYFIYDYYLYSSTNLEQPKKNTDLRRYRNKEFSHWNIISFKDKILFEAYSAESNKTKPISVEITDNKIVEFPLFDKPKQTTIIDFEERENNLWVFTNDGLHIFTKNKTKFTLKNTFFENRIITDVIKDRNKNYWVSTLRSGIYIIPNLYIQKIEHNLNISTIFNIHKVNEEALMFATKKGEVGLLNIKNEKFSLLNKFENRKAVAITNNKENLYLGMGKTSLIYNKKNNTLKETNLFTHIKDISTVGEDQLIFTLSSASEIVNLNSGKRKVLRSKRAYTNHYSKKNNEIYIGYVDNLIKYDSELKETIISFKNKEIFALDIAETDNNIIWISTFKDGIIALKNGKYLTNFTRDNGLLSNRTGKIEAYKNNLWITTDEGLQVLNTENSTFKNLTIKDGITSYNIFDMAIFKDFAYINSNDGLFKINKQKAFQKEINSNFYFSSVFVNDTEVAIKNKYILEANARKIKFNFKTNGFLSEENIIYKYLLLNENSTKNRWNEVSSNSQEIAFNNLAPGNYIFKLKSTSKFDDKKAHIKTVKILVKTPFYKTWWFTILCFLFLTVFILLFFNRRLQKIKIKQKRLLEKERLQKQLASTKLESLQSQMNPHFTFNALNSIQNLVLKGSKEQAYNYLTKYADLIRKNLNHSQKSFILFNEELELLNKYLELEKLRFRDNFEYSIYVDDSVESIKIPTMIIQPFVENAIKHGLLHKISGNRLLQIKFYQKETLECTIIDNGVGIKKSKEINKKNNAETSFSTNSIKEKLQFLKAYYQMDIGFSYEEIKEGTKVIIKIPYKL